MTVENWLLKNTASLAGKVAAISGATGGIGRELANYLSALGAKLVFVDRNIKKSEALATELRDKYGVNIRTVTADLEDFESVSRAAEELLEIGVDYLILNAGAYSIPRRKTSLGFDNVFQINFVSPYYLARRLMPMIKERGGRVVAVGSIAHRYSETDKSDIDFDTRSRASLVYGNAKRYLMYSLSDKFRDEGTLSIVHPGISFTGITAHYPKLIFAIIKYPMKVIFMKPRTAALSVLAGIFENTARCEWIGPNFFDVWGLPKKKKLKTACEEEIAFISSTADEIYVKLSDM